MMFALGVITGLLFSTIAVLFSIYLAMQNTSPVKQVEKRFGRKAIILEPDLLPKDQEGKDIPIEDLLWAERKPFVLNMGILQRY